MFLTQITFSRKFLFQFFWVTLIKKICEQPTFSWKIHTYLEFENNDDVVEFGQSSRFISMAILNTMANKNFSLK